MLEVTRGGVDTNKVHLKLRGDAEAPDLHRPTFGGGGVGGEGGYTHGRRKK